MAVVELCYKNKQPCCTNNIAKQKSEYDRFYTLSTTTSMETCLMHVANISSPVTQCRTKVFYYYLGSKFELTATKM